MSQIGKPVVSTTTILGLTPSQIISGIATIASLAATVIAPEATFAGMSVEALAKLAVGVVNEVPEAIQAVDEIKALASSSTEPTAEQWASWNAAADLAHIQAQAAADKVIAAG